MADILTLLYLFIVRNYKQEDFRRLCLSLRIPYDDLYGQDLRERAWGLILWMGRRKQLDKLLILLRQGRPHLFQQAGLSTDEAVLRSLHSKLQAVDDGRSVLRITGRKQFFDYYWDQGVSSIARRIVKENQQPLEDSKTVVGDYLLTIAAYMLRRNVRLVPSDKMSQVIGYEESLDDSHSIYRRIRDESNILGERTQDEVLQVTFVDQGFLEYVIARSLIRDWCLGDSDEATILTEIEALISRHGSFAQIAGAMVYLALWVLPLNEGEHWQRVIFDMFRELPEKLLDTDVFDALKEMLLTTGREAIGVQEEVLDFLKLKRVGRAAPVSIINILCDLAKHEEESIRRRVVWALGNIRLVDPELTRTVLDLLVQTAYYDSLQSVRKNAVTSLVKLAGKWAVNLFIGSLRDRGKAVRLRAAEVLGELGDAQAVGPLISVTLRDSDAEVRSEAAKALTKLADVQAAKQKGIEAISSLIAALRDNSAQVRSDTVEALGRFGDARAVESLATALRDRSREVRSKAAQALGRLGDVRAVKPLTAALEDSDPSVRSVAAEALGQLWDVRAMDFLIIALEDGDVLVRSSAAGALGKLGDARAVEPLIAALKDIAKLVRQVAAGALGQIGGTEALEALTAALTDSDEDVRLEAARALSMASAISTGSGLESVPLHLDAAVPDQVELNRAFPLAVAVRQMSSPVLFGDDPHHVNSGHLQVLRSEYQSYVHIRLQVSAPDCTIAGKENRFFILDLESDSPEFYFHLIPSKQGRISIIVKAYQKSDCLGNALVNTMVCEQLVGTVQMETTSVEIELVTALGREDDYLRTQEQQIARQQGNFAVIKMLFLAANPSDTSQLRLNEEMRAIDQALLQAEFRDRFDIRQHWAVRVSDLQSCLLRHQPDIVHFSGHGSKSSEIILEDNSGKSQSVPVHALSQLFRVLRDNIRCVVLNACYSERQARAIAEHIDCVIGMSRALTDSASISFAAAFYQALGFGRDIKTAFDLGCVQIGLEKLADQDMPKLLAIRRNPEDIVFAPSD